MPVWASSTKNVLAVTTYAYHNKMVSAFLVVINVRNVESYHPYNIIVKNSIVIGTYCTFYKKK